MKRLDVMVDLETLGKDVDSPIIQIGALAFDIETGQTLKWMVEYPEVPKDAKVDGGTLRWWLDTDKELLTKTISKANTTEERATLAFVDWIVKTATEYGLTSKDVYLWGNGILFDNKIIQGKCERYGVPYPIQYQNDRDMRTIVDLYRTKDPQGYEAIKLSASEGNTAHDAVDDCLTQMLIVSHAFKELTRKEE